MDGDYSIHPTVRRDVPGGWKEDNVNSFIPSGRTKDQNEAYDFMKKLLDWRKTKSVIHSGKLTHYIPMDNVYIYFRTNKQNETVMVVLNGNNKSMNIDTARFDEMIKGKSKGKNALTGEVIKNINSISIAPWASLVLELD